MTSGTYQGVYYGSLTEHLDPFYVITFSGDTAGHETYNGSRYTMAYSLEEAKQTAASMSSQYGSASYRFIDYGELMQYKKWNDGTNISAHYVVNAPFIIELPPAEEKTGNGEDKQKEINPIVIAVVVAMIANILGGKK